MSDHPAEAIPAEHPVRNFGGWRAASERLQALLAPTDWPARLALRLGAPRTVRVERHQVLVPASLGSGQPLRVAFASDFHAGPTTPAPLLDDAVAALAREQPDLLLLGGDFVCLRAGNAERLITLLGTVPAPAGRFAVLGNHDYWSGGREVARYLERAGIELLTNRSRPLPAPFGGVSVCGLDDHTSGYPDAKAAFADGDGVRLLLMHAPSGLLDLGGATFSVAFCGHTHGGQIALPGGRPLMVPHGPLSRRYHAGRFDLDSGSTLIVSRGIGCSTIPVRINAPPEIVVCTMSSRAS